jgi:hypothetical protein
MTMLFLSIYHYLSICILFLPIKAAMDLAHQVVVGCAADLPSGILQFSTNGVWVKPETFSGVQCAWASVPGEEEEDDDDDVVVVAVVVVIAISS